MLSCLPQLNMLDDVRFLEEIIEGKRVKRVKPQQPGQEDMYQDEIQRICEGLKAIESDVIIADSSSTEIEGIHSVLKVLKVLKSPKIWLKISRCPKIVLKSHENDINQHFYNRAFIVPGSSIYL